MEREFAKSLERAKRGKAGIKAKTFVFNVGDMEDSGQGNAVINGFCDENQVLSIVFNIVGDKLVYFIVYR